MFYVFRVSDQSFLKTRYPAEGFSVSEVKIKYRPFENTTHRMLRKRIQVRGKFNLWNDL